VVLPRQQPKLSPQTEFCIRSHTTALPTTRGSSGYILVVSSWFLSILYEWFIAHLKNLSHQQWSSHDNGWNSAHRLSFAFRPTPPPCQQQQAVAGWVLVSFQFFTNDLFLHLKLILCHQQWSSHENGRNSAHRLSLASCPAPPPCQQQHAVACIFSWWLLISFTIFCKLFSLQWIFFNS
jgi:hypothetical protein